MKKTCLRKLVTTVVFAGAIVATSILSAKTITLEVPDQFCGDTKVSVNFDKSVSIIKPQILVGTTCLLVNHMRKVDNRDFPNSTGVCSLLKDQSGRAAKPVGTGVVFRTHDTIFGVDLTPDGSLANDPRMHWNKIGQVICRFEP